MIETLITVFIAYDGTEFRNKDECEKYENNFVSRLTTFVEEHCDTTYCDDAGFDIIEASDVAHFLIEFRAEVIKFLQRIDK